MNSSKLFRRISFEFQLLHLNPKMPKMKKTSNKQEQKNNSGKKNTVEEKGAIYLSTKGQIMLKLHAKPGAKESGITDIGSEAVGIQISAPPVDGEANKELIRYLAEVLNLKKSELSLEKGSRSKEKTVVISGTSISLDIVKCKLLEASKQ